MGKFLHLRQRARTVGIPGYEGGDEEKLDKSAIQKMITDTIKGEVNTGINNAISNLKKTDLPKLLKDHLDPVTAQFESINEALKALKPAPAGGGEGDKVQLPPEVSAELKRLKDSAEATKKQMDQMQADKETAEKKTKQLERHTKIRTALSALTQGFANDVAPQTAFMLVEPLIKELEDGTLVGGDNLPVEDFVKDYLPKQHPYLLKPTGSGGAGASGGSGGGSGGKVGNTDMIKPGMSAEERQLVIAAIQRAGNNR